MIKEVPHMRCLDSILHVSSVVSTIGYFKKKYILLLEPVKKNASKAVCTSLGTI